MKGETDHKALSHSYPPPKLPFSAKMISHPPPPVKVASKREREDLAALSPYLTSHIKRFGDYLIDLDTIPQALDEKLNLGF
ncbi:transposase [Planktothrix agardhii 1033]|jgi:hypothetical protein|nr:transposase [Planktothrix agardhii 1033]